MNNFVNVESSNIEAIAIRGKNLIIKFKTGMIYEYINASCEYNNLLNASSKGKYFHQFIKNNYQYNKIGF